MRRLSAPMTFGLFLASIFSPTLHLQKGSSAQVDANAAAANATPLAQAPDEG
jgi:hypothetical protein